MRIFVILLAVVVSAPAMAADVAYPLTIPQECFELAQRDGVDTVMSDRYQAAKAKYKLARLSGRDPMVQECREAVKRAHKAATAR